MSHMLEEVGRSVRTMLAITGNTALEHHKAPAATVLWTVI